MSRTAQNGSVLSAALLISGTCIGISYFSMPIPTGIAGFVPAVLMTLLVWCFGVATGLLFAETVLGHPDGANLISISNNLLGKGWTWLIGLAFAISMLAYLIGYIYYTLKSSQWLLSPYFYAPDILVLIAIASLFCLIVYLGMTFACRTNFILMCGLLIAFILMIFHGKQFVIHSLLQKQNWVFIFFAVPILFGAMGFSFILPPLCSYLKRDVHKIRKAIFIGTTIPLIVYLFWQWFMLGSVQSAQYWVLYEEGLRARDIIILFERFPTLAYPFNFILFFSMTTSIISFGISLVDFLCDGIQLPPEQRKGIKRLMLCAAIFLCTALGSYFLSEIALHWLSRLITPIGEVLINGIIPVWMVAISRYYRKIPTPHMLPGGRLTLLILAIGILILIYLEGIVLIQT